MDTISEKRQLANQSTVLRNGTLGMIFFIATELMFFGGLISAFVVNAADNTGAWPPKWQPRLPVYETAFNTALLILSAGTMYLSVMSIKKDQAVESSKTKKYLLATMILGSSFVILQGVEWVTLISAGMTTTSSLFGAFFYVIVGAHGIHALGGVLYLIYVSTKVMRSKDWSLKERYISTISVFWYFVVSLWPALYVLVYILPSNQ